MNEQTVLGGMLAGDQSIPEGFPDHLSFREFLGFRGDMQNFARQLHLYFYSTSTDEKKKWLKNCIEIKDRLKRDAAKFPPQPLPKDVVGNPLEEIENLIGQEITSQTTTDFPEELERLITTLSLS